MMKKGTAWSLFSYLYSMKILLGEQIKKADQTTIEFEPISSIDLMERASQRIAQWIQVHIGNYNSHIVFLIGKGNNGGDGLAVARILSNAGFQCSVRMLYAPEQLSHDCRFNYDRLPANVECCQGIESLEVSEDTILVDAILGTGVRGVLKPELQKIIAYINSLTCKVIALDLPSGMKTEFGNHPAEIVHADMTLTLEFPKLAMLLPEAGECCGHIEVLPINLWRPYIKTAPSQYFFLENHIIKSFKRNRLKFSHKGTYGHALLVCGSHRMMGAAILATRAALRSGCGLVTVHIPDSERLAFWSSTPSAMVSPDENDCFSTLPQDLTKYTTIGIGCGLGQARQTQITIEELFCQFRHPMVIDADALNLIATTPTLKKNIPPHSILTPHPGELKRLVGPWHDEEDKLRLVRDLASQLNSIVILKGAYSIICSEEGQIYFNPTGSPGMAKGGSGDVLTGLLTGLLARGYSPLEASMLGVYIHGRAGEHAAAHLGEECMDSSDLIDFLPIAFAEI